MIYTNALQSPPRFQFETNSGTLSCSQTNNCGPACATKIACFDEDKWFGIEATRVLAAGKCIPTNCIQQRNMLIRRGVPAYTAQIDSIAQLRAMVAGGRRPVIIGVYFARVPYAVADHPFRGWHAILVMDTAYVNTRGFWVMDPNFSPAGGVRPDPDRGVKFYSESVLQYAFINYAPRWAVIPINPKKVTVAPKPPAPATEVYPMLLNKPQAWKANSPNGTPVYETPNGKLIRIVPAGTELTSIGEVTINGVGWRQVWVEKSAVDVWGYAKRTTMTQLLAPPASRTPSGDPAFEKFVKQALLARKAPA